MTLCRICGKPYLDVDIDHQWPQCSCETDPTCRHCDGKGEEWTIEENPETHEWHRVLRPCRCTTHGTQWLWVALWALLFGVLPAVIVGLR